MTDPAPVNRQHGRRLAELDALRGIAAIAVVLFHFTFYVGDMFPGAPRASVNFPYGWYGVQLFFAISGFVILMTLDRTRRAQDFALARFWRLFPTYWLAMAITFVAMHLFGPPRLQTNGGDFAANLSMLQLYLPGVRMVDGSYWSLNVEIVFYAVMLVVWRLRWLRRIEAILIGWIGLRWLWPWIPEPAQTLLLLDHIVYFAIGIGAYRVFAGQRTIGQQAPLFAVIAVTTLVTSPAVCWPLVAGLTVLFLAVAQGKLAWLRWRPLRWMGAISYPLYLVHGYIGWALILRMDAAGVSPDMAAWIAFAACVGLAAVIVYGFERPLVALRRAHRGQGRTLASAPA